jgi:cell division protein FtsB
MAKKKGIHPLPVIAAVCGIGLGVYLARGPWKVYQKQEKDIAKLDSELKNLQDEEIAKREKEDLKNPVKKEEGARRIGLVPKGEVPL